MYLSLIFVSFISTFIVSILIIKTEKFHHNLTHDYDFKGSQKFHSVPVPRIGGIAIVFGLIMGGYFFATRSDETMQFMYWAGVAAIPVFLGGLIEDMTKKVSARDRLLLAFLSASIAFYELNPGITSLGWNWFDHLILVLPGISLTMTLLILGGVAHATNIIDGFNGLLIGYVLLALTAFGIVSYRVGDFTLLSTIFIMGGSLSGFFLFNFPSGRIFTGDGGAYLIGFLLSLISLLILKRNSEISPWFPFLVLIYPVFETLFSIYRKKFLRGISPGIPDGIHFHMLIYRRVTFRIHKYGQKYPNPITSIIIWTFCLLSLIPSVIWWDNTWVMIFFIIIFCTLYLYIYFWIVRFGKIKRIKKNNLN